MRTSIGKYVRREQRLAKRELVKRELAKQELAKLVLEDLRRKEKLWSVWEESPAAACNAMRQPGAMAPKNTTQYLMSNVYDDMENTQNVPVSHETSAHLYSESLSPRNVYTSLDSGYDRCLAFQQRDFEEAFDLLW